MFNKMPNLQNIGYEYVSDYTGGRVNLSISNYEEAFTFGFHGGGFEKVYADDEFPYKILDSCKNSIVNFVGLFSEM
jgi:hypothetical protein